MEEHPARKRCRNDRAPRVLAASSRAGPAFQAGVEQQTCRYRNGVLRITANRGEHQADLAAEQVRKAALIPAGQGTDGG